MLSWKGNTLAQTFKEKPWALPSFLTSQVTFFFAKHGYGVSKAAASKKNQCSAVNVFSLIFILCTKARIIFLSSRSTRHPKPKLNLSALGGTKAVRKFQQKVCWWQTQIAEIQQHCPSCGFEALYYTVMTKNRLWRKDLVLFSKIPLCPEPAFPKGSCRVSTAHANQVESRVHRCRSKTKLFAVTALKDCVKQLSLHFIF